MKEIFSHLYVGGDDDYEKVKDKEDWYVVRASKEGPGGHRDQLGYTERSAPKGKDYLYVTKGRVLALNMVDADSPDFIPDDLVDHALDYASDKLRQGRKVLIACNQAESRAPGLGFLWLYMNGKLPATYHRAAHTFRSLYPDYSPNTGIQQYVKSRISAAKHRR